MKISAVNSYKTSFGYDKKLNKELKDKLSAYPDKTWANTIGSLNSYCNRVETFLRREEASNNTASDKYADLTDILSTAKQMLTGIVSLTFESLRFADREYEHYNSERNKKKNSSSKSFDWRIDVLDALSEWTCQPEHKKISASKKDEIFVPKFDENGVEIIQEPNASKTDKFSKPSDKSIVNQIMSKLSEKSSLEEFVPPADCPKGFSDVAGMQALKRDLSEGIIQLINNPAQAQEDFLDYGKTIPRAILLYGPPGCGKTYITQALASEINSPMYLLNIGKAGSMYINMTAKNIKDSFDEAISISNKSQKPCLLFMDEVDSIGFDRSSRMEPDDLKQVATLLQSLDKAKNSNVIVIAATNKVNLLDPALRRRFNSKVLVDVPDKESVKNLLQLRLSPLRKAQNLLASDDNLNKLSDKLLGYSASSIVEITKQAALNAMRKDRADISIEDFDKALQDTHEEKPNRKIYLLNSQDNTRRVGFHK